MTEGDSPGTVRMSEAYAKLPSGADAAARYFLEAKKRIGLLEFSLLDIQCLFYASIYEKMAFRTVQSWCYLQQAATRLRAHQLRRSGAYLAAGGHPRTAVENQSPLDSYQPEERLFWAIYKAER